MREQQSKTIEGITFKVMPLGFTQGRKAFVRLSKAIGPALAAAQSVEALQRGEGVTGVLEKLLSEITDSDLEWFAEVMGETTRYSSDGEKWPFLTAPNRETMFQGRLTLFFRWLMFCLEVNFSDFLGLLRRAKAEREPSRQNDNTPPAES